MNKPKILKHNGNLQISLFENQGKEGKFLNIQIRKSYKKQNQNWQYQDLNLNENDFSRLIKCLKEFLPEYREGYEKSQEDNVEKNK